MSEIIDDFDMAEWKEFLPGVYHLRSDKTKIAFLCVNPPPGVEEKETYWRDLPKKGEEKKEEKKK